MRSRALFFAVVVGCIAACGSFSGTDAPTSSGDAGADRNDAWIEPGGDASAARDAGLVGDGGLVACKPHAPVELLAASFDNGLTYSILGTGYSVPQNTPTATQESTMPGANGTSQALHIHSTGGPYLLQAPGIDIEGGACIVKSELDINFDAITQWCWLRRHGRRGLDRRRGAVRHMRA